MAVDMSQFKSELIYRDRASSAQILESIDTIRKFDRSHERLRSIFGYTMGISFLVALICIGCAFVGIVKLIPVAVGSGTVFVVSMIISSMNNKHDLPNRRYELLREVVDLLSRDMPKDSTFELVLDLAPANVKRKKVRQEKVGDWDVTYFEDPWLQLAGRLVDGTSFEIQLTDRTQARKKWARSRSGKSKLKTKSKSATLTNVSLFPKQKKYTNLANVVGRTRTMLRLPNWVQIKKVVTEEEKLSVAAITSEEWTVRSHDPNLKFNGTEVVVASLLSLYQVLHTSKAMP